MDNGVEREDNFKIKFQLKSLGVSLLLIWKCNGAASYGELGFQKQHQLKILS